MENQRNSNSVDLTLEQQTEVLTRINEFSDQLSTYNNDLIKLKENCKKADEDTEDAGSKKVNIFNRGNVVEKLQKSSLSINEALQTQMQIQEKMIKYQQETTKFMDFLFDLEASSMAANVVITEKLEEALGGGSLSKERIGEEAFEKVFSVVSRIKEQRSLYVRQDNLENRIFEMEKDNDNLRQENASLRIENEKNKFNKSKLFWVLFSILAFFSIAGFVFGIICLLQK